MICDDLCWSPQLYRICHIQSKKVPDLLKIKHFNGAHKERRETRFVKMSTGSTSKMSNSTNIATNKRLIKQLSILVLILLQCQGPKI